MEGACKQNIRKEEEEGCSPSARGGKKTPFNGDSIMKNEISSEMGGGGGWESVVLPFPLKKKGLKKEGGKAVNSKCPQPKNVPAEGGRGRGGQRGPRIKV